jgi:glycosyltransferase involved in cell wall biosynthesis
MHICLIRHAYFPEDPRDRKQAFALADAGFEVDVLCLRGNRQKSHEIVRGVNVFRIPLSHRRKGILRYLAEYTASFILFSALILIRFIKNRYECIQVSTMPDFLVFSTIIPKLFGTKILLDLHEPTPELWITKHGSRFPFFLALQTYVESMAIRYADQCITVTEALRRRFIERRADPKKIAVIPNVCEASFDQYASAPDPSEASGSIGFRMTTHGLIEHRYGHELVIEAMEMLHDKYSDMSYDIYGDGEYKHHLEKRIRTSACRDRIHLKGFVSFDDLIRGLMTADVSIIPMRRSPYSELIDTNKMYEYMALQKPIIISRLPAIENQFDDSCLMFFEPDNASDLARCIRELRNHPDKTAMLAQNAHRRYHDMRWAKSQTHYISIIQHLTERVIKTDVLRF